MPKTSLAAAFTWRRLALLLTVVLMALATQQSAFAAETTITIDNFTFTPATLTVAAGTTVTFLNRDDIPHRVAATGGQFKSPALDTDEKFSATFTTAGLVDYFCTLHPHMTGKIVVNP